MLVKRFSGDSGLDLNLAWEEVASIRNIENRLSQLSAWIIAADNLCMNYGLEIPGTRIKPGSGEQHKIHCLEALAKYGEKNAA